MTELLVQQEPMNFSNILTIISMICLNGGVILAAWIRSKTDIAAIKVELKAIDIRVHKMEEDHNESAKILGSKVEKLTDVNQEQHDTLSLKIDAIKESISDLKVQIAKK